MQNPIDAIFAEDSELGGKWNHAFRVVAKKLAMIPGQTVPGHGRAGVVRIMKAKIQRDPVDPVVFQRQWIAERMLLLGFPAAETGRWIFAEQRRVGAIIMLQAVHKPQNIHHQHVGNGIENSGAWNKNQHRKEYAATNEYDKNVTGSLVTTLRNNERSEDHDEMHHQVVCRDKKPLEELRGLVMIGCRRKNLS